MASTLRPAFLLLFLFAAPLSYARSLEESPNGERAFPGSYVDGRVKYNEELCEVCELVSEHLTTLLSDDNTTKIVVAALESSFCGKFSGNVRDQCGILLEEYVPEIISALKSSLESDNFCASEQICGNQTLEQRIRRHDSKCSLCKVAAAQFKDLIQKNETQAQILSLLYSACSKIKGGSVTDACRNVVDSYYPDILDILSSLSAGEFCTYIGYCSLTKALPQLRIFIPHVSPNRNARTQPGDCFACKMMVAYFRNKLKDADNQEKFKNTLLTSCEKVSNYVEECRSAVIEYLPVIYSNLDTVFNSTSICEKAGACTQHFERLIRLPSFRV